LAASPVEVASEEERREEMELTNSLRSEIHAWPSLSTAKRGRELRTCQRDVMVPPPKPRGRRRREQRSPPFPGLYQRVSAETGAINAISTRTRVVSYVRKTPRAPTWVVVRSFPATLRALPRRRSCSHARARKCRERARSVRVERSRRELLSFPILEGSMSENSSLLLFSRRRFRCNPPLISCAD